jgi:hypothetical protein
MEPRKIGALRFGGYAKEIDLKYNIRVAKNLVAIDCNCCSFFSIRGIKVLSLRSGSGLDKDFQSFLKERGGGLRHKRNPPVSGGCFFGDSNFHEL